MLNIPPINMVMTGGWFIIVLPTLDEHVCGYDLAVDETHLSSSVYLFMKAVCRF